MKTQLKKLIFKNIAVLTSIIALSWLPTSFAQNTSTTNSNGKQVILQVIERDITVNGKKSRVFRIVQPDGTWGYVGEKGQRFNVILENKTHTPTSIHWHGIILPNDQDGVPYVTQYPIGPGSSYHYNFPFVQAGTYWMHSHLRLQEGKMMDAPLIIYDPADVNKNEQQVVMFLEDFSFKDPEVIFDELQNPKTPMKMNMGGQTLNAPMQMNAPSNMPMKMNGDSSANKMQQPMTGSAPMNMGGQKIDLNDVNYDAYLTNERTLSDPDIIKTTPGKVVRLRIINGSASSNFFINLGTLTGTVVAIDGENIQPMKGSKFQIAVAQRMDILVTIPQTGGAFPVLAQGEGTKMQTGLILATPNAAIPRLSEMVPTTAGTFDYSQELALRALHPLAPKKVDRVLVANLDGNMVDYKWTINNQLWPYVTPMQVKQGERVELIFNNRTNMEHPMHFHGHFFEVVEIDGKKFAGALRDTVNVMPHSTVKVLFDANNPGIWMMHCHNLYHQAAGMMTTINYIGYPEKFTQQQQVEMIKRAEKIKK